MKLHFASIPNASKQDSIWPVLLGFALTLFLVGITLSRWLVLLGGLALAGVTTGWVRDNWRHYAGIDAPAGAYPVHRHEEEARDGHSKWWWGVVWLIVTEAMLFVSLFLALTAHSVLHDPSAPEKFRGLNTPLAFVASLALWASSVFGFFAGRALERDRLRAFHAWMAGALLIGVVFLAYQVREYVRSYAAGFTLQSGPAGAIFYAITGLHGLHVIAGVVALLVMWAGVLIGRATPRRNAPVKAALLYWHFVGAVWIAVYAVLYLKLV